MSAEVSTRSKWSMLLGNLFEHYDTALFGLLSPFLAPLFFPGQDRLTGLILTYCIIPLGMLARPIGSLFFGYIGDTYGRKEALITSLTGMAIVTACMGFLPTHTQVGFMAPVLLSFARILQNFFGSGEAMGGAIFLIENAPESQKDMMSSFFNASTIAGILLASFGVSVICSLDIVQDCWRLLYFLGSATALFAVMLRMNANFNAHPIQSPFSSLKSVLTICWKMRQPLLAIAIASGFSYATYHVALVMMNGFIPLVTAISTEEMMHLNTLLLIFDFCLLPLFGWLAHQYSREKMMIISAAATAICGFPLFWCLSGASMTVVVVIRFLLVAIGVAFAAPFYSWAQQLVPATCRYTGLSLAYAVGSQLLGGPTAALSLWLYKQTDLVISAGLFWIVLGVFACLLIAKQAATLRKAQTLESKSAM